MTFNPNGVGVSNGNIFGFPIEENNLEHVIISIPWSVTASYQKQIIRGLFFNKRAVSFESCHPVLRFL